MNARSENLDADFTAPGQARRVVAETLLSAGWDQRRIDDAVLLASEVVTNAVKHAHGPITLFVRTDHLAGQRVAEICVDDTSPETPSQHSPAPADTTGRGVTLLEELSEHWGVRPRGDQGPGKTVWFQIVCDSNIP